MISQLPWSPDRYGLETSGSLPAYGHRSLGSAARMGLASS